MVDGNCIIAVPPSIGVELSDAALFISEQIPYCH